MRQKLERREKKRVFCCHKKTVKAKLFGEGLAG